ncbi:hypothetical protein GLOIN_2v1768936 [Rhizophagus irregularis DAOM 181602=DAOM 197198]|nr:hypothetical protein GLOIN_2v1768936 [Rhizophagus irregularis DAOM 181602=DAOM 197198]
MSTRGDKDKEFAWDFAYHWPILLIMEMIFFIPTLRTWISFLVRLMPFGPQNLQRIARVYGGDSTIFNLLKLYALQIYDHNAIVYEMIVPYRELYLFREVIQTELPTSQVNLVRMRQCIPKFLLFKEMLCKSLSDLREYIMEAGLHTPPEKIKASLFVTEMTYTPHQKRIIIKKK